MKYDWKETLSFATQSLWFNLVLIAAFLAFLGLFYYAFITTFLPAPEDGFAPFIEDSAKTQAPGTITKPLDQPNHSYIEMQEWAADVASKAFTFQPSTFDAYTQDLGQTYFSAQGFNQYIEALQKVNVRTFLMQNNFKSDVLVEGTPFLLNEGAVEGRYSWLYEVPLIITYRPLQRQPGQALQAQNVRLIVRMQIGRIQDPDDPLALVIDLWSVLPQRSQP